MTNCAATSCSCEKAQPHALMFPFPTQSHINPMMQLAHRLLAEGFFITFVNTDFNHERMLKNAQADQLLLQLPNLRFEHIADGLPPAHMRFNGGATAMVEFIAATTALSGPFAKLVRHIFCGATPQPPLTCIIADSFCTWMQDVADQFRIPRVSLWTTPIHANLAYHFQSTLASRGLIPVTENSKLAEEVNCIAGVAPMKLEDYVSFFLVDSTTDFLYQWFLRFCMKRPEDALWNLGNNFEGLEKEALTAFNKEVPNFLPIGPLLPSVDMLCHGCGVTPDAPTTAKSTISLWREDSRACMDWLSQHDTASVVYISFGSIVSMSDEELADIVLGIEESGAPFLWAVRPDQGGAVLADLRKRLDEEAAAREGGTQPSLRALIVSWAPQAAVLMHPSVGLFISHCGWNSVTESLVAGVPILCKPGGFAEQRMNAQYVERVWKVGLQLPAAAACTPSLVKVQVCTLLGKSPLGTEVRERVKEIRRCALQGAASPSGGSSYSYFRLFVDDMRKRAPCIKPALN